MQKVNDELYLDICCYHIQQAIEKLMAGTITDWEASSRYKESFFATAKQLENAVNIYRELERRIVAFLK